LSRRATAVSLETADEWGGTLTVTAGWRFVISL
jgi:nitrogen fixation protein